jgi:MATE family multidrug resistance protein
MAVSLSWPIMVVPTWLAWQLGWGLFWAWAFATAYVLALGTAMFLRFVQGKWQSMRVIEKAPPAPPEEPP